MDGEEARRINLRKGLRSQPGLEIASEATNGETGLVLLDSIGVDVAIICDPLPDMSLATFLDRLHQLEGCQTLKLLVLSDRADVVGPQVAIAIGHAPYLCPTPQLAAAIQALMAHQPINEPLAVTYAIGSSQL